MRRFIAFFRRFRVFLVFLTLQIFALTSYFSIMSFPRTKFFNSSQAVVAQLLSLERDVVKYLYLDESNREIQADFVELNKKLPQNFISIDERTAKINDTLSHLSYEYIPATVINSSYNFTNNYFTINAGSEKGIQRKMGVVSSNGIVGIVYDVSKHFAIVKSILTEDINISAYIQGEGAFGLIKYEEKDPRLVKLTGVSNDIVLKEGSLIKSRGSGGHFPPGLPIGKIKNLQTIEGKPLWDIDVELHQDMRKLRYVFIIKNIYQQELDGLEKNIEQLQ